MPNAGPEIPDTVVAQLGTLLAGVPLVLHCGEPSTPIHGIEYDSRKIKPGDLFVALTGGYFDGHDFVGQAESRGAVALFAERELQSELPQVIVPDSRAALAQVAATFYKHPSRRLDVVGITGTDGKTTTSLLIESIFDEVGLASGVIGTVGVRMGQVVLDADTRQTTPESLDMQRHLRAMVNLGAEVAIVEATSHGLDLHRLDAIRFATGAVTNITREHLEHHKTIGAYHRAKAILFERVGESSGNSIINLDDEGARSMLEYAGGSRVMTYSMDGQHADLVATEIELRVDGSRFVVAQGDQAGIEFETRLVGEFNVANALCAIGVALQHDISLELCKTALRHTPQIPGRMEPVQAGQPFAVIVDYAHTPESVEKVLRLLRRLTTGRIIIVMGSAGERDRTKRPIQGALAARFADFAVFSTEDPRFEDAETIIREIAVGAADCGSIEGVNFECITDRREAIARALALARPGDTVLLAGKGHERSIIWGHEKRPWNEAGVARALLAELGYRRATE